MTEHKAFKDLIKKYRSITRVDIAELAEYWRGEVNWNAIKRELTGFKDVNICNLCVSAGLERRFFKIIPKCKNCDWVKLTGNECVEGENVITFGKIDEAESIESLWKAYQARADYMERVLKENEKPDIKPCPFCGSEIERNTNVWDSFKIYNYKMPKERIICKNCKTIGPIAETKEEAIEKWNLAKRKEGNKK